MHTATIPSRVLYPVGEFCQLTAISRATAYRLMARAELAFVRIGGERRIPASELERALKTGISPTPIKTPNKGKSSLV